MTDLEYAGHLEHGEGERDSSEEISRRDDLKHQQTKPKRGGEFKQYHLLGGKKQSLL